MILERVFFIVYAPTGPRLLTSTDDARLWLENGFRVDRVETHREVSLLSLNIEHAERTATLPKRSANT